MANNQIHSVNTESSGSDFNPDYCVSAHPFCKVLQERAQFDTFKHLIIIKGVFVTVRGKRKNKISLSQVGVYVSLVREMCAYYIPDTNKVGLSVKQLSAVSGLSYSRVWRALRTLDNVLNLIAFDGGIIWFRPEMFDTLRVGSDEVAAARRGNSVGGEHD